MVMRTGTTYSYQGVMVPKVAARDMFRTSSSRRSVASYPSGDLRKPFTTSSSDWVRDSGISSADCPERTRFHVFPRAGIRLLLWGIGTSFDMTDPQSESLRSVIVDTGLTLTLPTGIAYDDLTLMNMYSPVRASPCGWSHVGTAASTRWVSCSGPTIPPPAGRVGIGW